MNINLLSHCSAGESLLSRLCIVKEESTVPLMNESDSLQNSTSSNTTLFDEKNGMGAHYHQMQTLQHQQQVVNQGANQCCTGQSTSQQNSHQHQQDSSSEASTTTGHLSTISNNVNILKIFISEIKGMENKFAYFHRKFMHGANL